MRNKSGYSLVEMIVVMGAMSVIMTLGVLIIHGLMNVNRSARQGLADQANLARLAETFRNDVHAASAFESTLDGWEFSRADGTVFRYRILKKEDRAQANEDMPSDLSGRLVRETLSSEGPVQNTQDFILPERASVAMEKHSQGETTLMTLVVRPGETAAKSKGLVVQGLCVEAQLGRDQIISESAISPPTEESTKEETPGDQTKTPSPEESTDE